MPSLTSEGRVKVNVIRNNLVECEHLASVLVADSQGNTLLSAGPPARMSYFRSLAKPFQALPLIELGVYKDFQLDSADLAIVVSSHNGESYQVDRLRSLFRRVGLTEDLLECGVHAPFFFSITQAILAEYGRILPIHNNCSGKHAGMLILAKHCDVSLNGYTLVGHPVQRIILQRLLDLMEISMKDAVIGVDGCGVPTLGVPLVNIARLYALLASTEEGSPLAQIRDAMISHPDLIGGTGRFETVLMSNVPFIAKSGADGLMAVAIPGNNWGVVVKVDSGSGFIADVVAMSTLRKMECLSDPLSPELMSYFDPPLLNCRGEAVGNYQVIWP